MGKIPNTKALIFCGGVGTRLWPMSRKSHPKQFQPLVGTKSMFEVTVNRVMKGFSPENIFIATGAEYLDFIKKQAPLIPLENIIAEPVRRDTMGAVGLATKIISERYPDAIIAAIWGADHIVKDESEFNKVIKISATYALEHSKIVKIDVRPTFPSVHNGWVEMGEKVDTVQDRGVHEFVRFIEKPDYEKAKTLFNNRNFLINTGYLVWPAQLMLDLYEKYQPETFQILNKIGEGVGNDKLNNLVADLYPLIPKISVDYAIFEKLDNTNTVVIPADLGWTDVGTWQLLYQGLVTNPNIDNLTKGNVELIDVERSLIYSNVNKKVISVIGVNDVCVVDTEDGLVICDIHRTDEIKKLIERLEGNKEEQKYL